jgi:hypothetical protein
VLAVAHNPFLGAGNRKISQHNCLILLAFTFPKKPGTKDSKNTL